MHDGYLGVITLNQLIAYLRQNLILDFQGDLTIEMVREFLKDDNSQDAKLLMDKLVSDRGVNEMMLVLADCLVDAVRQSLTDSVMRDNLRMYSES